LPADYFCRDWLDDHFYEVISTQREQQEVVLTDQGLRLKEGADDLIVHRAIASHVDWLFQEYNHLDNNEP